MIYGDRAAARPGDISSSSRLLSLMMKLIKFITENDLLPLILLFVHVRWVNLSGAWEGGTLEVAEFKITAKFAKCKSGESGLET